jgi:Terminase large subunit, T4likevirus-type, N-terminal
VIEIRLPQLHPAQAEIIASPARFKVLACGRRFGKTTVAIDQLCNTLLDGKSAAYFAPTFRMGAEVWRELNRILRPVIDYAREDDWRMELKTGGVFEGWSLAQGSGEMVRGRKYHFVVVDEAALFDSGDVWHGAIRPLLTDYAGRALFCSTPKGRGWFWQLYQQGQDPDMTEWQSWRFPTAANPHIQATEIEAARVGMPERFYKQEYEAVFLDDGGVVFRNVEGVCTLSPSPSPSDRGEQISFHDDTFTSPPSASQGGVETEAQSETEYDGIRLVGSYYFGVDWGKDNDYTCISVMTSEGQQVHLDRFNQIGWALQRGRLAALYEQFKPVVIVAETNSMGSVNNASYG